jgi:hypothetical protein
MILHISGASVRVCWTLPLVLAAKISPPPSPQHRLSIDIIDVWDSHIWAHGCTSTEARTFDGVCLGPSQSKPAAPTAHTRACMHRNRTCKPCTQLRVHVCRTQGSFTLVSRAAGGRGPTTMMRGGARPGAGRLCCSRRHTARGCAAPGNSVKRRTLAASARNKLGGRPCLLSVHRCAPPPAHPSGAAASIGRRQLFPLRCEHSCDLWWAMQHCFLDVHSLPPPTSLDSRVTPQTCMVPCGCRGLEMLASSVQP